MHARRTDKIRYNILQSGFFMNKEPDPELLLLQRRLRDSQRMAGSGSWEFDATSSGYWWSEEMFALFDVEMAPEAPPMRQMLARVHPDDAPLAIQSFQDLSEKGDPYGFQIRVLRRDGSSRWVQGRGKPIFDAAKQLQRVVGTATDITDHKEIDEALQASKARQCALQAAALDAIITIDSQEQVLEWNGAAEKLFGYIALEAGEYDTAIAELEKGNLADSFVLGLIARAYEKKGDAAKATEYYRKVMAAPAHSINTAFSQQWARKYLKPKP